MANTIGNVFAAMPKATGALLRGVLGTTLPTSARQDITAITALVDQGFIGEDGFTQSEARDTDKKKAFGGTVVKVLQTDYSVTIQFAFLESINAEVLKSIYGEDNVQVGTALDANEIVVHKNKKQSPHAAWVIDVFDGEALIRTTIADGQITEVDDIVKVHTDTIMYTVTMECFEDENGDNLLEYIAVGDTATPPTPVAITTTTLPNAAVGDPYNQTLAASGGAGLKTWSLDTTSDPLPAGLSLTVGGVLSGTPTVADASVALVFKVEDLTGTDTQGITLVVDA